jgi:hypothetical protein
VKGKDGETAWRRPHYATIHRIIKNPVYGGAYAYGKTAVAAGYDGTGVSVKIRRKARSDWLALMPNAHEGYVSWEKLTVVGPGAIAAAIAAEKEANQRRDQVREALKRDLEAARFAADRAFRQYDAADPANRLVAGELEARWNKALARVAEVEAKIAAHDAATVPSSWLRRTAKTRSRS